jgi:hypothetical protein
MTIPLLERLQRGIFRRQARVAMGLGVTTQKLVEIHESSDENEEEGFGVVKRFIEVATYVYEITDITQKEVQPQMAEQ